MSESEWLIEVKLDSVPEGTPVEVYDLGVYPNGETTPVSDELVELYRINHPHHEYDSERMEMVPTGQDPMEVLSPVAGIRIFRSEEVEPEEQPETSDTENEVRVGSEQEEGSA
jgi:hypothetical protein